MERITVNGTSLAFAQRGSGALAVFIHGFPLDHRMWLPQLEGLSDLRWCVAPDLRGHGSSDPTVDPVLSPDLLADDIAAMIVQLGGHLADVVGLSMGGYVALALAERHPRLIRTMTLADTRAVPDTGAARSGRDELAQTAVSGGRSAVFEQLIERLVAPGADLAVWASLRSMIEGTPVETIVADLAGIRDRPDRTEVLRGFEKPVLAIVGEEDTLTPPSDSVKMARAAPDATLVTIPGAGHMAPMERPSEFNAAVRDFWNRRGAGSLLV